MFTRGFVHRAATQPPSKDFVVKRTWLAVMSCVVALQFLQTGRLAQVAFANGGGIGAAGGGTGVTTPPDLPPFEQLVTPGAYTIPVEGKVAGAADGSLRLVFTLSEGDVEFFTETRTVTINDERFTHRLGSSSLQGLSPSLLAGTKTATVRWARETTPSVVAGSQYLAAAPYAMTLSPGARIKSTSTAPALTVTNTSTGVRATASSTTGRGIVGESTSGAGNSYGVEGRAVSSSGAAGHFVNSEGDLIVGRASASGPVNFRVANNGDVYVRDVKIGKTGPKGDVGPQGTQGRDGPKGDTGPRGDPGAGAADTFCVVNNETNCAGVCSGGSVLVSSVASPCATSNGCNYGSTGRACCTCSSTR